MIRRNCILLFSIVFVMVLTSVPIYAADYKWSEWSTTFPSGEDYESKTQYRYADKEFITSGYSSVNGYTKSSENLISTSYGSWSPTKPSGSTSQNSSYTTKTTVESKSVYCAYSYVCSCLKYFWCNSKGAHTHSNGSKYYTSNRLNIYSSKSLSAAGYSGEWEDGYYGYKCNKSFNTGSSYKLGTVYAMTYKGSLKTSYKSNSSCTWLWQSKDKKNIYRKVSKKYNYTHWRWGSYSSWSDNYVSSSSSRAVQTRTLYRYKIYPKSQSIYTDISVYNKTYGNKPFSIGASAKTTLSYSSSNPNVATVDSKGVVTILKSGNVAITINAAKTSDYYGAETTVYVYIDKAEQNVSYSSDFKTTRSCSSKAANIGAKAITSLKYASSDTNKVSVDSKGNVKVKNPGTAKITITAKETSKYKSASKVVTIKGVLSKPVMASKKKNKKVNIYVKTGSYAANKYFIEYKEKSGSAVKYPIKIEKKISNGNTVYYKYKNKGDFKSKGSDAKWTYDGKNSKLSSLLLTTKKNKGSGYYRVTAEKNGYSSHSSWKYISNK